jgi:hypothetical protein
MIEMHHFFFNKNFLINSGFTVSLFSLNDSSCNNVRPGVMASVLVGFVVTPDLNSSCNKITYCFIQFLICSGHLQDMSLTDSTEDLVVSTYAGSSIRWCFCWHTTGD